MKFEGSVEIRAPRERVWDFLIDPDQVGGCGPGVQSVERIDDTHFKVHAKVGVGFISAKFVVNAEFVELEAPNRAVISARGNAPGSAVDATARMTLREAGGAGEAGEAGGAGEPGGSAGGGDAGAAPGVPVTTMDWTADVVISGTLASVGARMIEGTASKLIDQTFECVRSKLEA